MLVILIVEVCAPLTHEPNDVEIVLSTAQSTVALVVCVSVDIFVKFPDVNESVIGQVIVEPFATLAVTEVSEAPPAIDKFAEAVVNEPLSIWYSTL